jgi:hypothetical protein
LVTEIGVYGLRFAVLIAEQRPVFDVDRLVQSGVKERVVR